MEEKIEHTENSITSDSIPSIGAGNIQEAGHQIESLG